MLMDRAATARRRRETVSSVSFFCRFPREGGGLPSPYRSARRGFTDSGGFIYARTGRLGFNLTLNSGIASFQPEKCLKKVPAFRFEDRSSADFHMVIYSRQIVQVGGAAEATHFGIRYGVTYPFYSRHQHRARTHGAGFFGHINRGSFDSPIAELGRRLGDSEDFRVRGGVAGAFDGVMGGSDHFSPDFDNRADWHFVGPPRIDCLIVGKRHEKPVITRELRGKKLLERTGERRRGFHEGGGTYRGKP